MQGGNLKNQFRDADIINLNGNLYNKHPLGLSNFLSQKTSMAFMAVSGGAWVYISSAFALDFSTKLFGLLAILPFAYIAHCHLKAVDWMLAPKSNEIYIDKKPKENLPPPHHMLLRHIQTQKHIAEISLKAGLIMSVLSAFYSVPVAISVGILSSVYALDKRARCQNLLSGKWSIAPI